MIRLTGENAEAVYVSPEHIAYIKPLPLATGIKSPNGYTIVTESPEEVARKVLEWRLAMERYKAASYASASHPTVDAVAVSDYAERELNKLAGSEDTP